MLYHPFIYRNFIRPFFFCLDPEVAHAVTVMALRLGLGPRANNNFGRMLQVKIGGVNFINPVGLAAGADKNAEAMMGFLDIGFGSIEVGTITPLPQPGNPRPRMFRIRSADALINRYGFNSHGADVCAKRLVDFRFKTKRVPVAPIGVNISNNKTSTDIAADIIKGIEVFAPLADYLTVNISSPNTPGLRNMQAKGQMSALMQRVMAARATGPRQPPVFVKIAPDLTPEQQEDIVAVALEHKVDALIIGNTTTSRPGDLPPKLAAEAGGLSGKPMFDLSTKVLSNIYKLSQGKIPLIGCGGIMSAEDAYTKIRAGASLVQIYTGMVYEGPGLVEQINRRLVEFLKRDKLMTIQEAVGLDAK